MQFCDLCVKQKDKNIYALRVPPFGDCGSYTPHNAGCSEACVELLHDYSMDCYDFMDAFVFGGQNANPLCLHYFCNEYTSGILTPCADP